MFAHTCSTDSSHCSSSSPVDGHIPTPSVPGSDVPPDLIPTCSIPKNSGTSPTPKSTSTPPPPAVTPSTPTSTPGSPSPPSSTTVNEDPASSPPQVETSNSSSQSVPASDSIKEEALNAHNSFRALHGADPLIWDETVAKYAVDWTSGCVFEHSSGPYGGASSHELPLVIEDTYVLQRTWLLELVLSPSPTGSTCGRVKPRTMTPITLFSAQALDTSPRSCGRTPSVLDAPLPLVLLDPSTQRSTECVSFSPLLPTDLTREFRVELSTPFLQL